MMKSYVLDLFRYIETYENNYSEFKTEAFLQTYNGIIAAFQSLRTDRNQAVEVDYYFLDKIRTSPITSSDLRQLAIQLLVTRFEAEADTDGRSNQAYQHCRNLRAIKQDIPFFEGNLLQLLFAEGALNNNFKLNEFLLSEMAAYINSYGKAVKVDTNPEEFEAMPDARKILELQRRRIALGVDLLKDKGSLEFHLQRVDSLSRLGAKSELMENYLTAWGYFAKVSWWSGFVARWGEVWAKLRGAFKSFAYFRLLGTQRKLAYFMYGLIIVVFVGLAIGVPALWNSYASDRLHEFQQKANELRSSPTQ
ncbi:MAG: hypothetical protein JSU65_12890 [Candidatus Zixiibacteriota bacterium]|nr:MAG: hypothetical protein JSU65_12890 [candidate division Zixibacteria bacterium]